MGKWKTSLLSSGIPLEYEVAKTLVSRDFWIEADYTYPRNDGGTVKDFSVDIYASALPVTRRGGDIIANLELLVECKHRSRNIDWLFFPTPVDDEYTSGLGNVLTIVDEFSSYLLPDPEYTRLDPKFTECYKGVEIDRATGNVFEKEIRHGLRQLQYALPPLVAAQVSRLVSWHPDNNIPFSYCPILVTNAPLWIAKVGTTTENIENAAELADIADEHDFLLAQVGHGPDFDQHCRASCASLLRLNEIERGRIVQARHTAAGRYDFERPFEVGRQIAEAERGLTKWLFGQVLVTKVDSLPQVLDGALRYIRRAGRGRQELPRLD